MYLRPHTLSLITTHQCTAACSHCCFDCTPRVLKAIPIERMHKLIDEASEIKSIKVVVFTGGECFLLKNDLDKLILRANKYGLITRCVTNGYWASSLTTATQRVKNLKDAGLVELNFSTGYFHEKYVRKEFIKNGVLASCAIGIRTILNIEIFKDSDFEVDYFLKDIELIKYQQSGILTIQRNVWMQNNGDEKFENSEEQSRFLEKNKSNCASVLKVLTVNPDQNLIACCGLHLEKIPDLHLGSIKEQTLNEVINEQTTDLIKIWLHTEGPESIFEFAKKHCPSIDLPVNSSHICETCLLLYKNHKLHDIIKEHFSQVEERILNKYFSSLVNDTIGNRELATANN